MRDFDWGMTMGNRILARFMRGIHDTAAEQGHTDRLSRRARGLARIGHAVPERVARAPRRRTPPRTPRSSTAIFEHADVVLTPMFTRRPPRVREFDGRGGARTLVGMTRLAPYNAAFNHTGQPAVSVPAGFTGDGFPLAAQLVGPPDSEALLVTLSAQLERAARLGCRTRPAVAA